MTNRTAISSEVTDSTTLFEFQPGKFVTISGLKAMLPDVETALFFGKVYELDYQQLSQLLSRVFKCDVIQALTAGDHSTDLQDYIIDVVPDYIDTVHSVKYDPAKEPPGAVLPELWASLEIEVAASIKQVAEKLASTVALLPGKQGQMVFNHMAKLNKQRPVIGTYAAHIQHERVKENLVILDVSGSMTESTVSTILADVVALAYNANAHLAIVSNSAFHWLPGEYTVAEVLRCAQFAGTYYEKLMPLLNQDWGTVITIADYDSGQDVRGLVKREATGHIDTVLDISLVNRPTYLSQCLGEIADKVRPILVGNSYYVLD